MMEVDIPVDSVFVAMTRGLLFHSRAHAAKHTYSIPQGTDSKDAVAL